MVLTLTVASELDVKDPFGEGNNRYFLSQGRTVASANKNIYKYLCKIYDNYFKYDSGSIDLMFFLQAKFARWQNNKDTWKDEDSWTNQFKDFSFPPCNRAGIVEISAEMYNRITEEYGVKVFLKTSC